MLNRIKKIGLLVIAATVLYACNVKPHIMFKAPKDYNYDIPNKDSLMEFKIANYDILEFRLFAKDGFKLIDMTAISEGQGQVLDRNNLQYLVEHDGFCNLPILGRVKLAGMTVREAESFLEEKYSKYYNNPFIILKIVNKRITVFPGTGGKGQVITLNNFNTTLIEALGYVGGPANESKAKMIKVIRGDLKNPQVYHFDLSTIKGINDAHFVLQPNDIVYVEPRKNTVVEVVRDVAPVVSLLTSTITLIIVINNLSK